MGAGASGWAFIRLGIDVDVTRREVGPPRETAPRWHFGGPVVRRQHRAHRRPDGQQWGLGLRLHALQRDVEPADDERSLRRRGSPLAPRSVPPWPSPRTGTRPSSAGRRMRTPSAARPGYSHAPNGAWSHQGGKLVPTNASGSGTGFGSSVALSADGNIAADRSAARGGQRRRRIPVHALGRRLDGAAAPQRHRGDRRRLRSAAPSRSRPTGRPRWSGPVRTTIETGAVFIFAPPNPVCNSVSATGPQGGGSIAVSLSCTLPFGAHLHLFGSRRTEQRKRQQLQRDHRPGSSTPRPRSSRARTRSRIA